MTIPKTAIKEKELPAQESSLAPKITNNVSAVNGYGFDDERHIHTLNGKPLIGTTTLIKEVMPPMLSYYGSGMACKAMGWYDRKKGRTNYLPDEQGMPILQSVFEKVKKMTTEKYLDFLDLAYVAHDTYKKEKGDWGTQTHEAIETAVKEAIKNDGYLKVEPYANEAVERFATWGRGKRFIYSEVHCYSEFLWLGGIIDLIYENNGYYMGDVKTSKTIYSSQIIQEGLYDCQQQENGFYAPTGKKIGDALKIEGYTIINIPQKNGLKICTYRGTQQMREFSPSLVQLYKTLQELKTII